MFPNTSTCITFTKTSIFFWFSIPFLYFYYKIIILSLNNLLPQQRTFANIFTNAFLFAVCLSGFTDDGRVSPIVWLEVFDLTYRSIASPCDADVSWRRKPFSFSNAFFQFLNPVLTNVCLTLLDEMTPTDKALIQTKRNAASLEQS